MMKEKPIILTDHAHCEISLARRVRQKLKVLLRKQNEPTRVEDDLLLACSEHLTNLAQHSQGASCEVLWFPGQRVLEIRDNGEDMMARWQMLSGTHDALLETELKESGMGMPLVRTLFPKMSYRPAQADGFNRLMLPLPKVKPVIAVIDDDPFFLTLCEAYLETNYEVRMFSEPQRVLVSNALEDVSLVICDVHMPTIKGPDLRAELLEQEHTALLPFIFLTGDESERSRHRASKLQIDDYLTKPVSKNRLLDTVNRVLVRTERVKKQLNQQLDNQVNRSLWPKGPWQVGGLDISFEFVVAERGGGDFLYHKAFAEKHRFVLGDVMGHGEQAKFHAFAITGFLTGLCESVLASSETPADMLNALSTLIHQSEVTAEMVVTLQVFDIHKNGTVAICTAGHPPPFLIDENFAVTEIETSGALPGLSPDNHYDTTTFDLQRNSAIFAYTDGLSEALLQADDHGSVLKMLQDQSYHFTSQLNAKAFAQKLAFANRQLEDDVCIFVINNPG